MALVQKFTIDMAKSQFFDRPINAHWDKVAQKGLSRWAALARQVARRSLRKARRKRVSELTPDERQRFRISQAIAKKKGLAAPKRPFAPSNPGEPPRMRSGLIKKFLFFAYDRAERSAIIGPAEIERPTGAPRVLEEGGSVQVRGGRVRIAKRPYMKPVFDDLAPRLPRFLAGQK